MAADVSSSGGWWALVMTKVTTKIVVDMIVVLMITVVMVVAATPVLFPQCAGLVKTGKPRLKHNYIKGKLVTRIIA